MTGHPFERLDPRGKPPATVRAIETWIQQAEKKVGIGSGRLGWMIASGVVIAALQRSLFADGEPRFLIKGGAYLEIRLGLRARATKDVDTLFRGSFEELIDTLDTALAQPFDGITFRRTEPTQINAPEEEAKQTKEVPSRSWPPTVIAHPHWQADFIAHAREVGLDKTLNQGVDQLNSWIQEIDQH